MIGVWARGELVQNGWGVREAQRIVEGRLGRRYCCWEILSDGINEMVRRRVGLRLGRIDQEDHHHAHRIHRHRFGQDTFHRVPLGEHNKILVRKKFSRTQLLAYTANLPASLIGLEACAGAHCVVAALREQGHEVRLIPAQFVKLDRKSNKNGFLGAEAIAEAVTKRKCASRRSTT